MTDAPVLSGKTGEEGIPERRSELVASIARLVDLEGVFLRHADLYLPDPGDPISTVLPSLDHEYRVAVHWAYDPRHSVLGCLTKFIWKGTSDDTDVQEDELPTASIRATFQLVYSVATEEEEAVSQDALNQFAHWNAVFNVWPFWREFLRDITGRTAVGPVLAPTFPMPVDP